MKLLQKFQRDYNNGVKPTKFVCVYLIHKDNIQNIEPLIL